MSELELTLIYTQVATFVLAPGNAPGEFVVKAKVAGIRVDEMPLSLDELLENQSQGRTTMVRIVVLSCILAFLSRIHLSLTRQQVVADGDLTLDVNITIHLLNKTFLGK